MLNHRLTIRGSRPLRRFILSTAIVPAICTCSSHADLFWNGGIETILINPTYDAGLFEGQLGGGFNITTPNPQSAVTLGLRMAQDVPSWGTDQTWVYTGQINAGPNGTLSFVENIDDNVQIKVDGTVYLSDTAWNVPTTTGVLNFAPNSYHDFEVRVGNFGGPGGAVAGNGFTATYGFGFSQTGATGTNGALYTAPNDPGDGSLFRYATSSVGGEIVHVQSSTTVNLVNDTDDSITEASILFEFAAANSPPITLTINPETPGEVVTLRSEATTLSSFGGRVVNIVGNANFAPGVLSSGGAGVQLVKNGGTGMLVIDRPSTISSLFLRAADGTISLVGNPLPNLPGGSFPVEIGPTAAAATTAGVVRLGSSGSTTFANGFKVNPGGTAKIEHIVASNDSVSGPIKIPLSPVKTLTVDVAAGSLAFSGTVTNISAAASGGILEKTGADTTLRLNSTQTVTPYSVNLKAINVSAGTMEVSATTTITDNPIIAPGATLSFQRTSGNNLRGSTGGVITVPSGTLEATPGALTWSPTPTGSPFQPNQIVLSGGTLRLLGATNGLTADLYNGDDGGAHNAFGGPDVPGNTFTNYLDYFTGRGPGAVHTVTTAGGVTELSFQPGGPDGPMYLPYGYTAVDNIVSRFFGRILIRNAGIYNFTTTSDDGSMLFIDGTPVVSNNVYQGMTTRGGQIDLTAGMHEIDIGFYEGIGGDGLVVTWSGPGIGGNPVLPNSVLYPSGGTPSVFANPVTISNNATIESADVGSVTPSVTMNTGSELTTTGAPLTINNLLLNGNATLNALSDVTVGTAGDGPATATLTKIGPDTLTFTGAVNLGGVSADEATTVFAGSAKLSSLHIAGGAKVVVGAAAPAPLADEPAAAALSGDSVQAVPEPGSLGLLALGALGLLGRRRRFSQT